MAFLNNDSHTISSVSDGVDTWTQASHVLSGIWEGDIWYTIASTTRSETITVVLTGGGCSTDTIDMNAIEMSGLGANPTVATATGTQNGGGNVTSMTTSTSVTFSGTYLLFAAFFQNDGTFTPGTNFTYLGSRALNAGLGSQYSTTASSSNDFPYSTSAGTNTWLDSGTVFYTPTTTVFFESGSKRQYRRGNQRTL